MLMGWLLIKGGECIYMESDQGKGRVRGYDACKGNEEMGEDRINE